MEYQFCTFKRTSSKNLGCLAITALVALPVAAESGRQAVVAVERWRRRCIRWCCGWCWCWCWCWCGGLAQRLSSSGGIAAATVAVTATFVAAYLWRQHQTMTQQQLQQLQLRRQQTNVIVYKILETPSNRFWRRFSVFT